MEKKRLQLETKILQMTRLTSKGILIVKVRNHPHTNMLPKSEIVRRGSYKCKTLEMHLQLRDGQLKIIILYINLYIYIYETMIYIKKNLNQNFRVTANQKSIIYTHTHKKK